MAFECTVEMVDILKPGFKTDIDNAFVCVFEQAHRFMDAKFV